MAWWVLPLLGVALLLPSANFQVFDGLPLSSPPEFVALVLLVPALASRALRRLYARGLRRAGSRVTRGLLTAGALAFGAKLALLATGSHTGFLACYQSPLASPPGGACERSFEHPLGRFAVTRIDRRLDFEPTTWQLSFVNSLRFNFYQWKPGLPRRERLPLLVTWRGSVEHAEPWTAQLTYVGDATVEIGPDTHLLPAHYGPPRTMRVPVPAGRHELRLNYRFDDGARTGQPAPPFPGATLRLAREQTPGAAGPIPVTPVPRTWRVVAAAADGLLGLTVLSLVPLYLRVLLPTWWILGVLGGASISLALRLSPIPRWLPRGWIHFPFLAGLAAVAACRPRPRVLLACYFGIVALSLAVAGRRVPSLETVLPRSAGDDWLTYESQARTMLDTGSLQGGERVFYNAPLYRYVRFLERLLLGDGDLLVFAAGLAALYFAAIWMVARLGAGQRATGRSWGLFLAGTLILMLTTTDPVARFVLAPLSEAPTWTALLAGFPLLFAARTSRAWLVGAALVGLASGIRPNQLPGIVFLVAVFLGATLRQRPRAALLALAMFLGMTALPLVHNLYYGGRMVLLAASGVDPATLTLPPRQMLAIGHDATVRERALAQIRQTLYLEPLPDPALRLAMHGLQAAWLLSVGAVIARWRRIAWPARVLLLWPAAFLGVHLFYTPLYYFPRHIVQGYLSMGIVASYVASGRANRMGAGRPAASRSSELTL